MKIAELFTSLQGEGLTSGYPTIFVRLAGCNLSCSYCDTPAGRQEGEEMSVDDVIQRVLAEKPSCVCITGGEPLLQKKDVAEISSRLINAGKRVIIETNGTIPFDGLPEEVSICMDVKCPSSGETSDITLLSSLKPIDSVKFVVGTDEDLNYTKEIITTHPTRAEIFISPVYGTDYQHIATYILSHNLPARMQLQLHKFIGLP
ncbi:radical SAM protein [Methanospirillum sp.]|uniref:7-carboxy-7-deazaguanine synthase QueE n=2 Tax=Methanospirillum sp. TaxID=45200 RepID=UPI002B9FFD82|nr:radical SAM protein [Methanospirillum sp.]HOL42064.1 radical SAM protein [Methanospirillum sp.]HPP77117.1 radical SAM protein [Methanospirillum sp.]